VLVTAIWVAERFSAGYFLAVWEVRKNWAFGISSLWESFLVFAARWEWR
jgi:hypothetical protein